MTRPFRDPIIYTGAPLEPAGGKWVRLHDIHICVIGREDLEPGTIARWRSEARDWRGGWVCREHANPTARSSPNAE